MNHQPSTVRMDGPVTVPQPSEAEAGYMLVAVVVMVALVLISLSVAAPVIAKQVRRDKEVETEHRAEQYVRAIRLYYRKFHNYPPSIDALKQSNNIRFLRQEYTDPLTGKADWRILHLGEQKTTVKGFFGQELAGIGSSGMGSSLGSGLGSASGMSSGLGSSIGGTSGLGGTTTPGSTTGTPSTTIGATSGLAAGFSGATIGGTSGSTGASGATGGTGSTDGVGGGAIVGVGPGATGSSILTPNQQATYETWEFWYDPRIEQMYQKGQMNMGAGSGGIGSTPASSFGTGLNGQPNGTSGLNGLGSGLNGGTGSTSPTNPTTPTSPPQP